MSTSNPSDAAISNSPSYPTFEELFNVRTKVTPSTAGRRIFWELNGPFPAALHVMKNIHSPTSLTPYFSNGTWHPISQESLCEPKISSVIVSVTQLQNWESDWKDCHMRHGELGEAQEGRRYGDLSDYDPNGDSDREEHLLGYCGEPRPRKKNVKILVKAASGTFVTVHDYLSTVHPWLMGLKEDITKAENVWGIGDVSDMMVNCNGLARLMITEKDNFIARASIIPNPAPRIALQTQVESPQGYRPVMP